MSYLETDYFGYYWLLVISIVFVNVYERSKFLTYTRFEMLLIKNVLFKLRGEILFPVRYLISALSEEMVLIKRVIDLKSCVF